MVHVVVVGGGPVGMATAIHAANSGLTVTVVEPRVHPIDKACGEGLMPSALRELYRIGVDPPGSPMKGIRYLSATADDYAEAPFRSGIGRGVRRTVLHEALARRVKELGIEGIHERGVELNNFTTHVELVTSGGGVIKADYAIAADGLHSPLRQMLGVARPASRRSRFGMRRHYEAKPWSDYVEVYWSRVGEAYVTPVADSLVGVAVLAPRKAGSYDQLLASFPALRRRLAGARPIGGVLGAGPLAQGTHRRTIGRTLLVGDAAGYVDALTGEGLAVGLAMAHAAVAAVAIGVPEQYECQWPRLTRKQRWSTSALVSATESGVLRRTLVPAAARAPRLFAEAVNAIA